VREVNFWELMVFTPDGTLVSVNGTNGATLSISQGVHSSTVITGGGDFGFGIPGTGTAQNPYGTWALNTGSSGFHNNPCVPNSTYTLRFPPTVLSQVLLVRRWGRAAAWAAVVGRSPVHIRGGARRCDRRSGAYSRPDLLRPRSRPAPPLRARSSIAKTARPLCSTGRPSTGTT
jgi:hypothetical protein